METLNFSRHRLQYSLVLAILATVVVFMGSVQAANAGHGPAHPPVDVVFIIDESGSMGPDIADVKTNAGLIASTLGATLDPRFALVGFGEGTHFGAPTSGAPHTHTNFTTAAGFSTALTGLVAAGGFEPGVLATSYAMNSITGYRSGAGVCVVLITDEDSDSGGSLATARADLDARGAVWFGIVAPGAGNTATNYGPNVGSMSQHTGGAIFSISSFRTDPTPVLNALLNACVVAVTQGISLSPATATNDVGTDHTVTATVNDSLGDPVVGTTVTFEVVSGPNTGDTDTATTDANGVATFTYTGDGGVETDTIEASFVDSNNVTQTSRPVTKDWVPPPDQDPPITSCDETTNPSGKNVPTAGKNPKSGQNPDGYYIVGASDELSGLASLVLADSASGWTFALEDGDKIKLTQAPGVTPNAKPGAKDTDWKIQIQGDALVTATDVAGNSVTVGCLVPPPPK